jgi:glutathione S-transferase
LLTFYYAPGSSSMASHIALEEAGAEYEGRLVNESKGEQRTEAYLKINPRGKVPALRLDDGTVITENIAIQTYVARTHPQAKLLPSDPVTEARALSLMSFFASSVHVAFGHIWRPERYTDEQLAFDGIRAKGRQSFLAYCKEIDGLLAGKEWFFDQFSTVDAYGFVFYTWSKLIDLPMQEFENYTAHKNRMLNRPAVRRTLEQEGIAFA